MTNNQKRAKLTWCATHKCLHAAGYLVEGKPRCMFCAKLFDRKDLKPLESK